MMQCWIRSGAKCFRWLPESLSSRLRTRPGCIGKNAQAVTGTLLIGPIEAQQLLLVIDIQAEISVVRLAGQTPIFLDFVVDGVEPDWRVFRRHEAGPKNVTGVMIKVLSKMRYCCN